MSAEQAASFHLPWAKVRGTTYVELDSLLLMLDEYGLDLAAAGACRGTTGALADLADALADHGRRAGEHVAWLGVLAGYVADDAPEPAPEHPSPPTEPVRGHVGTTLAEPERPPGAPTAPAERPPAPEHPSTRPSP